jgi:AraC-like DNA-binding protein
MGAAAFFNTVILLGILQGFIVIGLLCATRHNKSSNRLLAALIGLIVLASIKLYGTYCGWFGFAWLSLISQCIPLVMIMATGPLIFLYVKSLLNPEWKFTKKERLHFIPVLLDLVPPITVILYLLLVSTGLIKNNPGPWGNFIDTFNVYSDIPRWFSISIYLWVSLKYVNAFKLKSTAGKQAPDVKWLRQFIYTFIIFQAIWLVYLVPYTIPKYTYWVLNTFDWYPVYIPLAVIIYWLGIKGYIVSQRTVPETKTTNPLPDDVIKQSLPVLLQFMESEKAYLDPNLSLVMLAEKTGISQRTISAVLNQHLQKNFTEFVNDYRVKEFKERIGSPESSHLTIAGLALECGFSSQATFQRVFKNTTGLTPSEFITKKTQAA